MMQFDLNHELISIQASYLSLVPQYMLQLMPYMSKIICSPFFQRLKLLQINLNKQWLHHEVSMLLDNR